MNKRIKKKWIAALRSEKYKQGIGALKKPGPFDEWSSILIRN